MSKFRVFSIACYSYMNYDALRKSLSLKTAQDIVSMWSDGSSHAKERISSRDVRGPVLLTTNLVSKLSSASSCFC
jgi:hypothetical protein